VLPGIERDAEYLGGGLWDWLDPLSLVRAWPGVLDHYPDARLVFLGTRHPNPNVPQQKIVNEVISLSEQLGFRDRTIFFIEWLSYEDHASALAEADVGVSLHPIHIETHFSIRMRVLDYLWARLPVVVTEGDMVSQWIQSYGLGRTVPPHDAAAVSEALIEVLSRPKQAWYVDFDGLATKLHWRQVAEPLHRFCLEGENAADRALIAKGMPDSNRPNWNNLYYRAVYILKNQGLRMLLHRIWRYFQWRLAQFH
jgi:glycosyltransferase involved in cell wall biosynthesis